MLTMHCNVILPVFIIALYDCVQPSVCTSAKLCQHCDSGEYLSSSPVASNEFAGFCLGRLKFSGLLPETTFRELTG